MWVAIKLYKVHLSIASWRLEFDSVRCVRLFCLLSDFDVRGILSSDSDFGVSVFEISMCQVESD